MFFISFWTSSQRPSTYSNLVNKSYSSFILSLIFSLWFPCCRTPLCSEFAFSCLSTSLIKLFYLRLSDKKFLNISWYLFFLASKLSSNFVFFSARSLRVSVSLFHFSNNCCISPMSSSPCRSCSRNSFYLRISAHLSSSSCFFSLNPLISTFNFLIFSFVSWMLFDIFVVLSSSLACFSFISGIFCN